MVNFSNRSEKESEMRTISNSFNKFWWILPYFFALISEASAQLPRILDSELQWLGEQIFNNECASQFECLTSWNPGERFPSLGIGHFIWYQQKQIEPFEETFPELLALFNERGEKITSVGPATPVVMLGLNGAPQSGDKFNVLEDEKEAKDIAARRTQLQRELGVRTQKHITLDEIGRRIAIGEFKELNVIVKGDVDGSVEALTDAMLKISTEEIQLNVIHKSVGQIIESDVLLASASNAIIVGFQVRPSGGARKLAEQEQIDIRLYSVIYDAINEIKDAMEGMLAPTIEEKIVCNVEIRDIFKITKVGTIAGCMVLDGKITRNTKVRLIRDGIVVYTGVLGSLKRFKDDVKEVNANYECGLNIENYNDIKVGDTVEGYEEIEVKRNLQL